MSLLVQIPLLGHRSPCVYVLTYMYAPRRQHYPAVHKYREYDDRTDINALLRRCTVRRNQTLLPPVRQRFYALLPRLRI